MNALDKIILPVTGQAVYAGAVVRLKNDDTNTRYVLHKGWHQFDTQLRCGWFLCSIPYHNVLPLRDDMLADIIVLANGCCASDCSNGNCVNHSSVKAYIYEGDIEDIDTMSLDNSQPVNCHMVTT